VNTDWTSTLRQTLPRLGRVVRALRPTWLVDGVERIEPAFLESNGIRGLIWDIDGTLMAHHAAMVDGRVAPAFARLLALPGTRHVIASNCSDRRFEELGRMLPRVPVLKVYDSADGVVGRRWLEGEESWTPGPPRGPLRALRKPDERIAAVALRELGVPAGEVVVVGDQRFTDIALANLGGLRSIKVPTFERRSFPVPVRLLQRAEDLIAAVTS
jgi:predicted HAD superfamily phosphohydrolase YqeG